MTIGKIGPCSPRALGEWEFSAYLLARDSLGGAAPSREHPGSSSEGGAPLGPPDLLHRP